MKIDRIDHLVLTVRDVEATCAFYARVLGMEPVVFGSGRRALAFGSQKINLHPASSPIQPHACTPTPGSADLCFIAGVSLDEVIAHFEREGIRIIEGPVQRTGARGEIDSVYIEDPDGNLIEVSTYR